MKRKSKKIIDIAWALKSQWGDFVAENQRRDAPALFATKKIASSYVVFPKARPVRVEIREL